MKILHVLNELKFSGAEIMYVDAASIFQTLEENYLLLQQEMNKENIHLTLKEKDILFIISHILTPESFRNGYIDITL